MKTCTKCGETKEAQLFPKRTVSKDGLASWCKQCKRLADEHNYRTNPNRKTAIRAKNSERVHVRKVMIREYLLSHPCVDCGEEDPVVLEFDHLSDKTDNICQLVQDTAPLDSIMAEIAKCEVRCCNCHRRITAKRGNWNALLSAPEA